MDRRSELSVMEEQVVDETIKDLRLNAKVAVIPLANDDRAAHIEAALIRYLIESRTAADKKTAVIAGYKVELELDMNGDGLNHPYKVTGCWISRGNHSASLAALEGEGYLTSSRSSEDDLRVPENVIEMISDWAEENGY